MNNDICFVAPSLGGGGAERNILNISNQLSKLGYKVHIVVLEQSGTYTKELDPNIVVTVSPSKRARNLPTFLVKYIKQHAIKVVFSSTGYVNFACALASYFCGNTRFVCRESNTLSSVISHYSKYKKTILLMLYKVLYKKFHAVVAQSVEMKEDLCKTINFSDKKTHVINNVLDIEGIDNKKVETFHDFFIDHKAVKLVAFGRLEHQKGYFRMLQAMSLLPEKYVLSIYGTGSLKEQLEEKIVSLGLTDRVFLCGTVDNPYKIMMNKDLLLLTSFYEGYPNVVLEAAYCGLPVVAMSAPGVDQAIDREIGMVSSQSTSDFSEAVKTAYELDYNKNSMASYIRSNFSVSNVVKKYEELFYG